MFIHLPLFNKSKPKLKITKVHSFTSLLTSLNETRLVSGFYRNRRYLANLHLLPKTAHQNIAKIVSQNTSNF